jgi:hypothetical protein
MHRNKKPRILFILKYRHSYSDTDLFTHAPNSVLSSGLYNSASFVCNMLVEEGYEAELVHVIDANSIDREVTRYRPDVVIIEALWVLPAKFDQLHRLHPDVNWIVRIHSEVPFLALEGSAIERIMGYINHQHVFVAFNAEETYDEFKILGEVIGHDAEEQILYLPNYYPVERNGRVDRPITPRPNGACIDVGCFGSMRPLKNQLLQAIAAIEYAKKHKLCLRFHINSTRQDNDTAIPVLRNIRALFRGLDNTDYQLVEHAWLERPDFLELISRMDIGLQVSLTESFNIVMADFVSQGVPVVVSQEVNWVPDWLHAQETSSKDIVKIMERAMWLVKRFPSLDWVRNSLVREVRKNKNIWLKTMKDFKP